MRGIISAVYSVIAYVVFFGAFLYAIGFVQNLIVPKSVDGVASASLVVSLLIDLTLLGVFAVQHSVMARPAFKKIWTRVVPSESERSTYVLFASLSLLLLYWQWKPLPQTIWSVGDPLLADGILSVGWFGWAMVLVSTFLISHFHLFGLSQGFARVLGQTGKDSGAFSTPFLYRWLRHPIYAGFIIAFWATPHMSLGHLVFAIATTGYIFVGIWFEERDLITQFGDRYREYRRSVGMLVPKMTVASRSKRPV